MSHVIRVAVCVLALAIPSIARADDSATHDWKSRLRGWDASLRGGYGRVFTDGLSYLDAGVGGALGYHVSSRLRLELSVLRSFGAEVRASNDVLAYRSSDSSTHGA